MGFLKEWTLIRIEGEEPVEQVQAETIAPVKGGKAPPPKGAPGKAAAATGALEEITDNRPREI